LKVLRFGVVAAKIGYDIELSLTKIFNKKMAELIIHAYFGGEMRRLPKPAAYIDVIDHDGCVI